MLSTGWPSETKPKAYQNLVDSDKDKKPESSGFPEDRRNRRRPQEDQTSYNREPSQNPSTNKDFITQESSSMVQGKLHNNRHPMSLRSDMQTLHVKKHHKQKSETNVMVMDVGGVGAEAEAVIVAAVAFTAQEAGVRVTMVMMKKVRNLCPLLCK
jgi:hypothetical protein